MKLTLEIDTEDREQLHEAAGLLNHLTGNDVTVSGDKSPGTVSEGLQALAGAAKPAEQPAEEEKADDGEITAEDIRAKVNELIKADKRTEAKALLQEFGAATVPQLKAEDYAAFMEKAEAL